jgi:hypothetical protein
VIGGCLSIALASQTLIKGSHVDHFTVAWAVLGLAAVTDGASLAQTLARARREAAASARPTVDYLLHTSEPTLRAIAVEDNTALVGVAIAAGGLLLHQSAGEPPATLSRRCSSACCSRLPQRDSRVRSPTC